MIWFNPLNWEVTYNTYIFLYKTNRKIGNFEPVLSHLLRKEINKKNRVISLELEWKIHSISDQSLVLNKNYDLEWTKILVCFDTAITLNNIMIRPSNGLDFATRKGFTLQQTYTRQWNIAKSGVV